MERLASEGQLCAFTHAGSGSPWTRCAISIMLEDSVVSREGSLEGLVMDPDFWRGKRVLLTGHTGFKGGWLVTVAAAARRATSPALRSPADTSRISFEAGGIARGMRSLIGDIRDLARVRAAVADAAPEIVFHIAAQALVRRSYEAPVETYGTNVMGTAHLLEAVRQLGAVRAVVVVTSDKCYENRESATGATAKTMRWGATILTPQSKAGAELVTASVSTSSFGRTSAAASLLAFASARAGNVIGGGDWARDRLVPDILRAIENKEPVRIRNPNAIRPWQHVLEPLSGYMLLAQRLYEEGPKFAEGWNFGPSEQDARPVSWIVERLVELWGDGASWEPDEASDHVHEAHYLKLDCSKARKILNWAPVWPLEEALRRIVEWQKSALQRQTIYAMTLQQISDYEHSSSPGRTSGA